MPDPERAIVCAGEEQRAVVARLVVRGLTDGEIAATLRIPPALAKEEVAAIRTAWRASVREDSLYLRNQELCRLHEVLREAFVSLEKSKEPELVVTEMRQLQKKNGDGKQKARVKDENGEFKVIGIKSQTRYRPEGSAAFMAIIMQVSKEIRTLLGVDAPAAATMHLTAGMGGLSPEMLQRFMKDPVGLKSLLYLEELQARVVAADETPAAVAALPAGKEDSDG